MLTEIRGLSFKVDAWNQKKQEKKKINASDKAKWEKKKKLNTLVYVYKL